MFNFYLAELSLHVVIPPCNASMSVLQLVEKENSQKYFIRNNNKDIQQR